MQEVIDYALVRKQEKKIFERLVWLMLPLIAAFVYVMIRFALSGGEETIVSQEITSNGVFQIAQDFVRPTLSGFNAKFSTRGYEYGKLHDSVYMIRSYVDTKSTGDEDIETKFEITLKYNGGLSTNPDNWDVIRLTKSDDQ